MYSFINRRRQPNSKSEASPLKDTFRPHPHLLGYHEIKDWQKDNEYILSGYRPESLSAPACFASWTYVHNETANIYSYVVAAAAFLIAQPLMSQQISQSFANAPNGDYLIFSFFLWAAFACFSISFTYHTLMNHSSHVSHLCLRTDYVGIVVLTLGDFISGIYLVFYCEPVQRRIYWTMVCVMSLRDALGSTAYSYHPLDHHTGSAHIGACSPSQVSRS